MKRNLVLTGMMGVGKSTIARLLATKLDRKFLDVDNLIEKNEKTSIKKIFETNGEDFFRNLEKKTTLQILKKNNVVIALGGGAFINQVIRNKVLTTCISFWLDMKVTELNKRLNLTNKANKRPLLLKKNYNDLDKIYNKRKKIYNLANFRINCDKLKKEEIVRKILNIYENL